MANIRVREAAEYLGVSKSFLDKARCHGGGPNYMKFGAAVVYSVADLDAWMTSRRRESTTVAANDNAQAEAA
jgi:excisionase family DNA binding protein